MGLDSPTDASAAGIESFWPSIVVAVRLACGTSSRRWCRNFASETVTEIWAKSLTQKLTIARVS